MPENEEQEEILLDREDLILFDYPLDREIVIGGVYYRDPSVAENAPNFKWTVIEDGIEVPQGISYEVIAELYIPELDPLLIPLFETTVDDCVDYLIMEAMRITNNLDSLGLEKRYMKKGLAPKWTPAGRIRCQDNVTGGLVPLVGAKVRANHWFETREGLTNSTGSFNVGHTFRKCVDYSIKWERADFDLRSGNWGQAYFNGPCKKGDWDLDITSGLSLVYTAVHRAANRYYYLDNAGLRRPPLNDFLNNRIKIGVHDDCSPSYRDPLGGDFINFRNWATWPEIRVYKKLLTGGTCIDRSVEDIISTTFHELCHASHWKNGTRTCMMLSSDYVTEGWARCAQWVLTNTEYSYLSVSSYNFNFGNQNQNKTDSKSQWDKGYIPFYIDLIDNVNQRSNHSNNVDFAPDNVTGFNARDVENSVIGSKTLYQSWEHLKAQNKTNENDLWDLFDFYNNL